MEGVQGGLINFVFFNAIYSGLSIDATTTHSSRLRQNRLCCEKMELVQPSKQFLRIQPSALQILCRFFVSARRAPTHPAALASSKLDGIGAALSQ